MIALFLVLAVFIAIPVLGMITQGVDFFSPVFELSLNAYGFDLGEYLYGWNGVDFGGPQLYIYFGLITYFIPLAATLVFYYLVDSPGFSRWYHWLSILIVTALIVFGYSYGWVMSDYDLGKIPTPHIDNISQYHLVMWGVINAVYSIVLFSIFSASLRWWSTNCSTTPIPQ